MLKKCLNVDIRFMLFYYILTFKFINVCINFDDNIGFVKCQNLWSETLEIYETSELSENNETTETQWYNAKQFGWQRAHSKTVANHICTHCPGTCKILMSPRCKTSFASSDSVCHAWGWYLFAHLTDTRIALSVLSTTAVHSYMHCYALHYTVWYIMQTAVGISVYRQTCVWVHITHAIW